MSNVKRDGDNNLMGNGCRLYRDVTIKDSTLGMYVSIGDFSIVRSSHLSDKVEIGRRNTIDHTDIDSHTYTGEFCIIKYCHIGKYCAISWNVSIGGANHDIHSLSITPLSRIYEDEMLTYRSFLDQGVDIGNDVWIGAGAHVLRGVKIGDGSIVAANAVVTHNVEPYSIVAGVPAKKIGQRFNDDIINRLLKIKWWNWSEEKLIKAKDCFSNALDEDVVIRLEQIGSDTKEGLLNG